MNKHIAFAYAITGLAVAIAAVTTIGSSYGLLGKDAEQDTAAAEQASPTTEVAPRSVEVEPTPKVQAPQLPVGEVTGAPPTPPSQIDSAAQPVEIVYVDKPAQRHDDDDDRREHHKRKGHDKHQEHDDDDD